MSLGKHICNSSLREAFIHLILTNKRNSTPFLQKHLSLPHTCAAARFQGKQSEQC